MSRTRRRLIYDAALLLAVTAACGVTADELPRQSGAVAGKSLDDLLNDRKYHTLSIDRRDWLRLRVNAQVGQHPVSLLLDTASNHPISLSRRVVDGLKLPTRLDGKKLVATPYREGAGELYARVESLKIADAVTMTDGEVSVDDDSNQPHPPNTKHRVYEGLIGSPLLAGVGAIIDVTNAKMYVPGTWRVPVIRSPDSPTPNHSLKRNAWAGLTAHLHVTPRPTQTAHYKTIPATGFLTTFLNPRRRPQI